MKFPIQSYSWTIESDSVFIKNMDRSSFLHHETGIPKNVLEYFGAQKLQQNEKRKVTLSYRSKTYKAYFERTKNDRVRLMWDASFAHVIKTELPQWHAIYAVNETDIDTAPKIRFEKDDLYGIHFAVSFMTRESEILTQDIFDGLSAKQVRKSKKKSNEELLNSPRSAPPIPAARNVLTKQFVRDPDVAEFAKRRAGGRCDLCDSDAPFRTRDKEPYLETHHIVWLSQGGEDNPDNCVALCPNCHRKMHVRNRKSDREKLAAKYAQSAGQNSD